MNKLVKYIGNKYFFVIVGLLSYCITLTAQSIRQSGVKQDEVKHSISTTSQAKKQNFDSSHSKEKELPADTVYCYQTKKQHGWFAPLGIITKEEASHRNLSYRFTNRNSQGNWCKMEIIDGYGNYVTGSMTPYILKIGTADTDTLANRDWVEKIKTECIYEFIPDPTGKNIIQERSYDKDMNLIYTYSRIPIGIDSQGHNRYVGSYRDSYGLPAEMRKDTTNIYTYGTLVMLTEDIWGNDSIVEYMDAKGRKKLNSDGVAMEVFVYDKDGHLIKQQSRDSIGNLTIDNWGNCGVEYVWGAAHTIASATYMDDRWQPMRIPSFRETNGKDGVIKCVYICDKYGRNTEEAFYTYEGKPDVNKLGIHKDVYVYDDHGNVTELQHLGVTNNLVADGNGWAMYKARYNDVGKSIEKFWYNDRQQLIYKEIFKYDDNGKQVLCEGYSIKEGKEILEYKDEQTDKIEQTIWADGTQQIDSLDYKGRQIVRSFYDVQGNLRNFGDGTWAKKKVLYVDEPNKCYSEVSYFDETGKPIEVDGVLRNTNVIDSINSLQYVLDYDSNGIINNSFYKKWNSDYTKILAQYDANAFGIANRAGGNASVRYYAVDVLYSQQGAFASFIGRDEFNEPDYIVTPSLIYYYQRMTKDGNNVYYDENDSTITDFKAVKNSLPKIMTIEVVDSIAYQLGLRDNDVIIQYGDYFVDLSNDISLYDFRTQWSLGTILNSHNKKKLVVFRIEDAKEKKYGLVEINLPIGTASELGFLAHIRYLTQKQKNRIWNTIKNNNEFYSSLIESNLNKLSGEQNTTYIVMAFTDMYRTERDKPYAVQVTDPAILLGACIKDRGMYWSLIEGNGTQVFEDMLDTRKEEATSYPTMHYFLTKDMENVIRLTLNEQAVYTSWFDTKISNRDYAKLIALSKSSQHEMSIIKKSESKISTKDLLYSWQIVKNNNDSFSPEGYFCLLKDGTCVGTVSEYGKISFNGGTAIYKIDKNLNGTWQHYGGTLIIFCPSLEDNTTLQCIDLLGADDDLRKRAVSYMNSICEENKESLLNRMSFDYPQWNNDLFIRSVTKDTLVIEDGSTLGIKCVKTKEKNKKNEKEVGKKDVKNNTYSKVKQEDSPLVGQWETPIPDMPESKASISFNPDGQMELRLNASYQSTMADTLSMKILFDISFSGVWMYKVDSIIITNDPSLTKINFDLELDGIDDETTKDLKPAFLQYFDSQKEDFAMQLLKNNSFDGTMYITSLTEEELIMNNTTWKKILPKRSIVYGKIEGNKGYLGEQGLNGLYIVLKWCDWDCTKTINEYSIEFENKKEKNKNMILLPIEFDEEGNDVFGNIIELDCPPSHLGIRIQELEVSQLYFEEYVLQSFNKWKNKTR